VRTEVVLRPPSVSLERLWGAAKALPHYWDLLVVLTGHRIKVRYKQSVLGPFWAVLQPLALMLIFTAVFSVIASVPSNGQPYALFAFAGLLPWTAFASALTTASGSLTTHAALVTRVHFPREILPVTYVAAALFDLGVASVVMAGLLVYYSVALTPALLWIVPVVAILAALATTVSLVLSAVNVRYRDVSVAMPLLLQLWMFASPVIYPLSAVPDRWRSWYLLNPMVGIVDSFRRAVIDGRSPDFVALGWSLLVTVVLLPLAYVWFKHVDATMADSI
jgi:lipopolysaccharide transport system permease protein